MIFCVCFLVAKHRIRLKNIQIKKANSTKNTETQAKKTRIKWYQQAAFITRHKLNTGANSQWISLRQTLGPWDISISHSFLTHAISKHSTAERVFNTRNDALFFLVFAAKSSERIHNFKRFNRKQVYLRSWCACANGVFGVKNNQHSSDDDADNQVSRWTRFYSSLWFSSSLSRSVLLFLPSFVSYSCRICYHIWLRSFHLQILFI